jgi:hypothetical protein
MYSKGCGRSATGADERLREGEGCSWSTSKGEQREGEMGCGSALLNGAVGGR